ncbi:AT-hook motif nuclear-localized protein 28-like [Apium graveolens]|uniref:AT-hook motif nuclear-localized protein 28-like n=1 Tax=Apium graveolens TaxID=4045 RepID=UPI003D7A7DCF
MANNNENSLNLPVSGEMIKAAGGWFNGNTTGNLRPRGRPRGSKNKPKEEDMTMKPVTLVVPNGVNIMEWVAGFAHSNKVCITVVGGCGMVSLAILTKLGSQVPPQEYKEHLNLIIFSGTHIIFPSIEGSVPITFFNALLGRVNGAVIGGTPSILFSMGEVRLSAFVFQNPAVFQIKP